MQLPHKVVVDWNLLILFTEQETSNRILKLKVLQRNLVHQLRIHVGIILKNLEYIINLISLRFLLLLLLDGHFDGGLAYLLLNYGCLIDLSQIDLAHLEDHQFPIV